LKLEDAFSNATFYKREITEEASCSFFRNLCICYDACCGIVFDLAVKWSLVQLFERQIVNLLPQQVIKAP